MHRLRLIILVVFCLSTSLASDLDKIETIKKSTHSTTTSTSAKLSSSGDVNSEEYPFETSHKIQQSEEFQTSHRISDEALKQHRDDLHQSMRSKEKPELNEQLGELIAADIKNNIEAKRLSEYEHYIVEPLTTTEKPVLTTETVARSINEGLIDDLSILEEAGSENKQASRIQIKKGPNGQDYEYEYVYYYYDDDESKTEGDDDVIIGSRKGSSTTSTTQAPSSGGKSRYSSIERSSSTSAPEKNEIQSRGKARSQALPAPVVEEVVEERLPQVTRFPQRAKSANPSENASETSGKKQHVKRPSLELVDSHSFVTDEKDKNSKGPRIIETELSKSELLESVSKSSIEYASSTTEATEDDEEDTTPLMEKFAIDLYAILANENAKEDDKKSQIDIDETTIAYDDDITTIEGEEVTNIPSSTTTTTEAPTTTSTTTTEALTTTTELPKGGRGGLTAGRNRFKFHPKGSVSSTEAPTEAPTESTKPKNRFSRPSSSFSSRNSAKTTNAPEEVKEEVTKSEAPTQSSKIGGKSRNRFSLRNQSTQITTEKSVDTEVESTTASRLVKPRPQFSLRNRSRNGQTASTTESSDVPEESDKEEKPVEKVASLVPKPTSRLNLNRPTSRLLPGQKPRASHLNPRRNITADENGDSYKSANENESEFDTTTPNNLNKLKSRPRIQINADSKSTKKTTSPAAINRKVNPLISKRKFGVTSTTEISVGDEKAAEIESDSSPTKEGANDSEAEVKEDETTQAAEAISEQPRGLGLLNRRKIVNRRPGTIN